MVLIIRPTGFGGSVKGQTNPDLAYTINRILQGGPNRNTVRTEDYSELFRLVKGHKGLFKALI